MTISISGDIEELRFIAVRGNGFRGDIAFDNIRLTDGECKGMTKEVPQPFDTTVPEVGPGEGMTATPTGNENTTASLASNPEQTSSVSVSLTGNTDIGNNSIMLISSSSSPSIQATETTPALENVTESTTGASEGDKFHEGVTTSSNTIGEATVAVTTATADNTTSTNRPPKNDHATRPPSDHSEENMPPSGGHSEASIPPSGGHSEAGTPPSGGHSEASTPPSGDHSNPIAYLSESHNDIHSSSTPLPGSNSQAGPQEGHNMNKNSRPREYPVYCMKPI